MCCLFFITEHAITSEGIKMKSQAVHLLLHVAALMWGILKHLCASVRSN